MKANPTPSAHRLHELFSIDPNTGVIVRKCPTSGGVKAGQIAGWKRASGHLCVMVDHVTYPAHRIAYAMYHGDCPCELEIDHINGIRHDNRICNLRLVTRKQNMENKTATNKNTTGYKGVSFDKQVKKWKASICHNRKQINLGRYETAQEAAEAYIKAAKELFTHWDRV